MRLLSWNVNHRINEKPIPAQMADALLSLDPDVVILNEYVPGPSRSKFLQELSDGGLGHQLESQYVPRMNHVLIASRSPLERGDIVGPDIDPYIPPGLLHVVMPEHDLHVIGLRIPDFSRKLAIKRAYWDWIEQLAGAMPRRNVIIAGDFNTDPTYPKARCGPRFGAIEAAGWQHVMPKDGNSYWTLNGKGVRIDHALASPGMAVGECRYVVSHAGYQFVGKSEGGMSDHAVLEVDIHAVC